MTRDKARSRLERTIEAWKAENEHDRHAKAVCKRLLDSEAPDAFAAVCPDGTRWDVLLGDCIEAERRARTQEKTVRAAKQRLKDAQKKTQLVERAAKLFGRNRAGDGNPSPTRDAVNLLRQEAYVERLNAERVLKERSRETTPASARSAALGWLKESVSRASGAPNLDHLKVLADAALGAGDEVTIEAIRKAVTPSDGLWLGYTAAKQRERPDTLDTDAVAVWTEPAYSPAKKLPQ